MKILSDKSVARDQEIDNSFYEGSQITALRGARKYIGDRLIRVATPHKILDPKKGPLIAVRLHIVSRKTLGGLQTDLSGRVLNSSGNPVQGLYAAGEVAVLEVAEFTVIVHWKGHF